MEDDGIRAAIVAELDRCGITANEKQTTKDLLSLLIYCTNDYRSRQQLLEEERTQYWPILNDIKKFNAEKALVTEKADEVRAAIRDLKSYKENERKAARYDELIDKLSELGLIDSEY